MSEPPLHPEVVALLNRIYRNTPLLGGGDGKATFAEATRRVLALPPRSTTLRLNPYASAGGSGSSSGSGDGSAVASIRAAIERHFQNAAAAADADTADAAVPAVAVHPIFSDVITIPVAGPHAVQPTSKAIYIDRANGSSVMRGSPVFAAAVIAADATIQIGDAVTVWMTANSTAAPTSAAVSDRLLIGNGVALLSADSLNGKLWKPKSDAAATATATATTAAATAGGDTKTGSSDGGSKASSGRGVCAVRLTAPVWRTPTLYALEKGDCACGCGIRPGSVLLQNLPSVCAVMALGIDAAAPATAAGERVLDMCAAPGGKTSHIASLMTRRIAATATATATATPTAGSLVAFESNPNRCHSLRRLLREWTTHPASADAGSVAVPPSIRVFEADSSTLFGGDSGAAAADAKSVRFAKPSAPAAVSTASAGAGGGDSGDGSAGVSSIRAGSFDRVLLDPPCSGLGQRPHFNAGGQTVSALKNRAAYQRKLMRVAHAALRPVRTLPLASPAAAAAATATIDPSDSGGILVYSTCTLSPYENEANVRWLLDTFPDMKLVPPPNPRHHIGGAALPVSAADLTPDTGSASGAAAAGAGDSKSASSSAGDYPLLSDAERAMCQRFEPAIHDTIAFFIARFQKQPATATATAAAATPVAATPPTAAEIREMRIKRKANEKLEKLARANKAKKLKAK